MNTEPLTEAGRRRAELQERHRLQLLALDAYDKAVQHAAQAQTGLNRTVAEAVKVFGGLDAAAELLGITVKEARTHVAAHETAATARASEKTPSPNGSQAQEEPEEKPAENQPTEQSQDDST
jgi:hypothetical protein